MKLIIIQAAATLGRTRLNFTHHKYEECLSERVTAGTQEGLWSAEEGSVTTSEEDKVKKGQSGVLTATVSQWKPANPKRVITAET